MSASSGSPTSEASDAVVVLGRHALDAVNRAHGAGTPEAWQQAVVAVTAVRDAAYVVTEFLKRREVADQASQAAHEAANAAQATVARAHLLANEAQEIESIVATARGLNTPEAWSSAAQAVKQRTRNAQADQPSQAPPPMPAPKGPPVSPTRAPPPPAPST